VSWDIDSEFDPHSTGWADRVHSTIPRIDEDEMVLLRRIDKKLNRVMGVDGVKEDTSRSIDQDEDEQTAGGEGVGGGEVSTVEEEFGFPGPSRFET
jgi:hypothetical protein